VHVRHTVGLADRLTAADPGPDPGPDPDDGLPATLEAAVRVYGLRYFKLKLSGRADFDLDRLAAISAVLDANEHDWRVTLDGNETFESARALAAFWSALEAEPRLATLRQRTLLLEQPLPRALALRESIAGLGIDVPVILDESDDSPDAFERGLALGYRGVSSKACKGLYRSLAHARRVAQERERLVLSGEDLTCQAGLAVQQDTLLAASLGVAHIERNGHHYVDGFGRAPAAEEGLFADAHPGFYRRDGDRVHLLIANGRLDLTPLHVTGFASAAQPLWDHLSPL
jgi:L-alanine-DL-glutamate epimerase-like enolase superfamily enzyme